MFCNRAFALMLGVQHEESLLGLTDAAFSPPHLCEQYAKDDRQVMTTGKPLVDRIELVRNRDGSIGWHNTTKLPVQSRTRAVIGVAGVTRDLKKFRSTNGRFLTMAPVVETIMNDYAQRLSVVDLAAKAHLSVSQFERHFKERFHTTPSQYITQVRLGAASELLAGTDLSISDIAQDTGFYDQSHFTNRFVDAKGLTPRAYRQRYRRT